MKQLIIISLFLLMGCHELNGTLVTPQSDNFQSKKYSNVTVAENIKKQFEEFKKRMCREMPTLNITVPLDPFNKEYLAIDNFDDIDIAFINMSYVGLSNITIKNLTVNLTNGNELIAKFELKNSALNTSYTIIGNIPDLINIDGEGKISTGIDLDIDVKLRLFDCEESKRSLIIDELEPFKALEFKQFEVTGIFPDVELNQFVKGMVQDIGKDILNDIWMDYKDIVIFFLQEEGKGFAKILCDIIDDKPIFDDETLDCHEY